jgi:hypothetical protein
MPFNSNSLKVITDGTMKFTDPVTFNDPFDCKPVFRPVAGRQAKAYGNLMRKLTQKMGVLSLSKNALNVTMWSHYADSHRGFVVEFRVFPDWVNQLHTGRYDKEIWMPQEVSYHPTRPVLQQGPLNTKNTKAVVDFMQNWFFTKSPDWEYEEEYRVVIPTQPPGVYPFDRQFALCSVIAGINMPEEEFDKLAKAVDDMNREDEVHKRKCYRAQEEIDGYGIFVPGHPRLDFSSLLIL